MFKAECLSHGARPAHRACATAEEAWQFLSTQYHDAHGYILWATVTMPSGEVLRAWEVSAYEADSDEAFHLGEPVRFPYCLCSSEEEAEGVAKKFGGSVRSL